MAAAKNKKDTAEMLGEFFREAAVLVSVFFPLEMARQDGKVSLVFLILVACLAVLTLVGGMVIERMR